MTPKKVSILLQKSRVNTALNDDGQSYESSSRTPTYYSRTLPCASRQRGPSRLWRLNRGFADHPSERRVICRFLSNAYVARFSVSRDKDGSRTTALNDNASRGGGGEVKLQGDCLLSSLILQVRDLSVRFGRFTCGEVNFRVMFQKRLYKVSPRLPFCGKRNAP
jgi:hypothetical protein